MPKRREGRTFEAHEEERGGRIARRWDCAPPKEDMVSYPANWQDVLRTAIERLTEITVSASRQVGQVGPVIVPIETLVPDPYRLKRPVQVVVQPVDGEFQANLFDANIGTTADTQEEAVEQLKSLIVDTFEFLEQNEGDLGPEPSRQLAVLREILERQQ